MIEMKEKATLTSPSVKPPSCSAKTTRKKQLVHKIKLDTSLSDIKEADQQTRKVSDPPSDLGSDKPSVIMIVP